MCPIADAGVLKWRGKSRNGGKPEATPGKEGAQGKELASGKEVAPQEAEKKGEVAKKQVTPNESLGLRIKRRIIRLIPGVKKEMIDGQSESNDVALTGGQSPMSEAEPSGSASPTAGPDVAEGLPEASHLEPADDRVPIADDALAYFFD